MPAIIKATSPMVTPITKLTKLYPALDSIELKEETITLLVEVETTEVLLSVVTEEVVMKEVVTGGGQKVEDKQLMHSNVAFCG